MTQHLRKSIQITEKRRVSRFGPRLLGSLTSLSTTKLIMRKKHSMHASYYPLCLNKVPCVANPDLNLSLRFIG